MGTKPATVQFQTFTVKPGEAFDWHYHKAVAYVAIKHGTLSERHINEDGTCSAWVALGGIRIRGAARRRAHGGEYGQERGGGHMGHSIPDRGRNRPNPPAVQSRRRLSSPNPPHST